MKSNFFRQRLANDKNITLLYSTAKTKYWLYLNYDQSINYYIHYYYYHREPGEGEIMA